MKKNIGFNLLLVVLVAALMATVSCAKKTSVSDPLALTSAIEDEEAAKKKAEAFREERERKIKEAELERERAQKKAAARVLYKFENDNILFAFDSWKLSSAAQALLRTKAAYLKDNPYVSVRIEGHCDERGTTEYNLALGERRASEVKSFLMDMGIRANRIGTISYGEERPLNSARSEYAYSLNRRAQFVLNK